MTTQRETARTTAQGAFGWRFVTPMFMGSALNPVNSSLIATALVPIAAAMGVSVGRTAVLVIVDSCAHAGVRNYPPSSARSPEHARNAGIIPFAR